MRWWIVLALVLVGAVLLAAGAWIVIDLRSQLEGGLAQAFSRWVVRRWPAKQEEIAAWRRLAAGCLLIGPVALVIAYGFWRRQPLAEPSEDAPSKPKKRRRRRSSE